MAESRVFRAIVTAEILVTVDPARSVTVTEDMIALDTDDGESGRVEFDALLRDAISEHDAGPDLWTVPGEIEIGPIQELVSVAPRERRPDA